MKIEIEISEDQIRSWVAKHGKISERKIKDLVWQAVYAEATKRIKHILYKEQNFGQYINECVVKMVDETDWNDIVRTLVQERISHTDW